jgi:hypothetical protein
MRKIWISFQPVLNFLTYCHTQKKDRQKKSAPELTVLYIHTYIWRYRVWRQSQWPRGLICRYRLLACWDCGFESRRIHGHFSLVSVVCCQVERYLRRADHSPRGSYRVWCVWVWSWSLDNEGSWPTRGCCTIGEKGRLKVKW